MLSVVKEGLCLFPLNMLISVTYIENIKNIKNMFVRLT